MSAESRFLNVLDYAEETAFQLSGSVSSMVREAVAELDKVVDLAGTGGDAYSEAGIDEDATGRFSVKSVSSGSGFGGFATVVASGVKGADWTKSIRSIRAAERTETGERRAGEGIIPPEFPEWKNFSAGSKPVSGDLDEVSETFTVTRPSVSFGSVPSYEVPTAVATDVGLDEIVLAESKELPAFPSVSVPSLQAFLEMRGINVPSIDSLPAVDLMSAPSTSDLPGDEDSLYLVLSRYRAMVPTPADESSLIGAASERALRMASTRIRAAFSARYTDPLPSVVVARLAARTEARKVEVRRRFDDALSRVIRNGGWGLPELVRSALNADVLAIRESWERRTDSKTAVAVEELTRDFFEHCGDLYAQLRGILISLNMNDNDFALNAFEAATKYANGVCELLLKRADRELRRIEFEVRSAAAKIEVVEASLKVAMAEQELIQIEIEYEGKQQTIDASKIEVAKAKLRAASSSVSLWKTQLVGLKAFVAQASNKMGTYKAKLELFKAQQTVDEMTVLLRAAEVDGDAAEVKYRRDQVELYQAQVNAFKSEIAARTERTEAQLTRNEFEVERFTEETRGNLRELKLNAGENEYMLTAYRTGVADYLKAAKLEVEKARVRLSYTEKEADGVTQAETLTREALGDAERVELERLKGIAEANMAGARQYAGMALQAMSSINDLASLVVQEG